MSRSFKRRGSILLLLLLLRLCLLSRGQLFEAESQRWNGRLVRQRSSPLVTSQRAEETESSGKNDADNTTHPIEKNNAFAAQRPVECEGVFFSIRPSIHARYTRPLDPSANPLGP